MSTNQPPNFSNAYAQYYIDRAKKDSVIKQNNSNIPASAPAVKTTYSPTELAELAMPFAPSKQSTANNKISVSSDTAGMSKKQDELNKTVGTMWGIPYLPRSQKDVDALTADIMQVSSITGPLAPEVRVLDFYRNEVQKSIDKEKEDYMAKPADWTVSELEALSQKENDSDQYRALITSDDYINENWQHWLELSQPGRTLTTEERKEAKEASWALNEAIGDLYWSYDDPSQIPEDVRKKYDTYAAVEAALESKYSKGIAAVYGAMEVLPADELRQKLNENSEWFRQFQDSLYNDKAVADLMAQSSLTGNAQTANPGWYTAGNIAGNAAAAMAGGAALSATGITSAAAGDAIVSGLLGGTHSAVKQDWSKPGQAAFNTLLDAGANAALAYGGGKLVNKLDDLIRNNWYGTGKSATAADTNWPETTEELFDYNPEIRYIKDAGKIAKSGEPDNPDNAIKDLWNEDGATGDLATEGAGDSLSGPVEINPPSNATPEQIAQTKAYIEGSNQALQAGKLSPTGRVSTKGTLRDQASRAADRERSRALAAGTPYMGQVGHVPDTTWTGTAEPFSWMDLDPSVNMSIGGQANRYLKGYKPTEFRFRDR